MASHVKKEAEARQGKTPQGRQFYQRAQQCLARGDTTGAANNLKMALTFEPSNALFKQQLDAVRSR
jgi:hypothetical protein